jgi:hypothetical protein
MEHQVCRLAGHGREQSMLKEKINLDALGAEALPGGLAEILRTLQPALKTVLPVSSIPVRRGLLGFFARRKKPQGVVA